MLRDHFLSVIKKNFDYQCTGSQEVLLDKLSGFVTNGNDRTLFLMRGYAGTGKTTVISSLVRALSHFGMKSVLLAPTGRAAKVLSSYSGKQAFTIHKKIYRQKSSKDGFGEFALDRNLHRDTIFIVDEASMISNHSREMVLFGSGRLLDDLISYVYNDLNCRLILVGDSAQLPPVGIDISPALDNEAIKGYGLEISEANLTDVIRQAEGSGILCNATSIRDIIRVKGTVTGIPEFNLNGFDDIIRLDGRYLVEEITGAYDNCGMGDTLVVTRSNKQANKYNQGIRNQILWREEMLTPGDYMMVVRNNYYWLDESDDISFIANGDIIEILRIHRYEERYGYRFADVTLRFTDYGDLEAEAKIMIDTINLETASLSGEDNKAFFYAVLEDYADEKSKKKRYDKVRKDPFFNALQVKFAYAVTCHKAQGGQWHTVFVDQGYVDKNNITIEYLRWLYTAFTRATDKLYLVNFKDEYFKD